MLVDHIDTLTAQTDRLTARIEELLAAIPAAQPAQDQSGLSHRLGGGGATGEALTGKRRRSCSHARSPR